jgi:cytochrome c5
MMGGGPGGPAQSSGGNGSASASSGGEDAASSPVAVQDSAPPPVNDPVIPGTPVSNPQDAFTGAPNYTSDPPTIRANDQHGGTIVTGKSCLDCHNGTTCVLFDFAGTVWQYPALTSGVPDVEVRIIDANNLAYDVHSDVDGNFWHRANSTLAMPAFSGVRTSDWKAIGTLNGTSCNSCHYAGNTSADAPPGPPLYVQQ